jgi:hypothetical protein
MPHKIKIKGSSLNPCFLNGIAARKAKMKANGSKISVEVFLKDEGNNSTNRCAVALLGTFSSLLENGCTSVNAKSKIKLRPDSG